MLQLNEFFVNYIAPGSGSESKSRSRRGRGSGALLLPTVKTVLQCCGSGMFIRIPDPNFSIPDPNFFHTGPGSTTKILSIFLSSRKYDPGCSSWFFTHPGVEKAPDPGYRFRIRNTGKTNSRLTSSLPYRRMSHHSSYFSEAFVPWAAPPLHPLSLNHKPFVIFWIRQGLLPSWSCSPFLGVTGSV